MKLPPLPDGLSPQVARRVCVALADAPHALDLVRIAERLWRGTGKWPADGHITTDRRHGYRRRAGAIMDKVLAAGLVTIFQESQYHTGRQYLLTDAGRALAVAPPIPKLSLSQRRMLEDAVNHGEPFARIHGQSAHGGADGTIRSLIRLELLDEHHNPTDLGRAAVTTLED